MQNYQYDEAGNITMVTAVTDAGSATDERTVNNLNQITEQAVGGDTWTFSYDDNGNMTGRTNGTDTWIYSWIGDENRLVRVQGPGSVDVRYSYDSIGRMLTRDDGGPDITQLAWDNWSCCKEITGPDITYYHIPDGVLRSFTRGGITYQVHLDSLGSVRLVTDEEGEVVARLEWAAWGEKIGGFGSVPGGLSYGWIGSAGIREDSATGMLYMRSRWYEPSLGRFLSRDPVGLSGGVNLYAYVGNSPCQQTDPLGLGDDDEVVDENGVVHLSHNETVAIWTLLRDVACEFGMPPEMLITIWALEGSKHLNGRPRQATPMGRVRNLVKDVLNNYNGGAGGSTGLLNVSPSTAAYALGQIPLEPGVSWEDFTSSQRNRMLRNSLSESERKTLVERVNDSATNARIAAAYLNTLKSQLGQIGKRPWGQLTPDEMATLIEKYNAGSDAPNIHSPHGGKHHYYHSDQGKKALNIIVNELRKKHPEYCECP